MKSFLIFSFTTLSLAFSFNVSADTGTDVGVMFGVKNANYSSDTAGMDYSSEAGLMGGAIVYGRFGDFSYRTGGYYAERKTEIKQATNKADFKLASLDIPVTMMYSFSDVFSVFGGAVLSMKLSDSCSGNSTMCDVAEDELKSFMTSATVGLSSKFHPNWTGEVFYEHGLSDLATDVSTSSISAALVFIY